METIGVNLLWLEPGVVGGSEEYTLSLLRAIHDLDPLDLELRLFSQHSLLDHHPDLGLRFEVITAPRVPARKIGRVATEHTWLARQVSALRLIHHAGGIIPGSPATAAMLTVLDLQPLDLPANFGRVKRNWLAQMLPRSVAQAKLIVTPSAFTAGRLVDLLDVPADMIRVVPFGVVTRSEDHVTGLSDSVPEPAPPTFLYPAIAYPHKRHADLVDALALVRREVPDARLVLTGRRGPCSEAVARHIADAGLDDAVDVLGRVDRQILNAWYRRSTAVVIPSEYEGFGLPALEAMQTGTPLIVANAGASPEIAGDAALVVPPRSAEELAAAMIRVATDPLTADQLSARGRERAARFTWVAAGTALIDAYRDALN